MKKLWDCIETVKTGGKVACSISSSLPQLTFIQSIYDSDVETAIQVITDTINQLDFVVEKANTKVFVT